ncbi:hypothetical protein [Colwellia sp. E2M01]|uniref:hypothetical protein n=1 Tax=Colwellia sp. E2M01 TaxID=2841561 RepID=UPI001C0847DD|nr:hypothetical protein [Colwellia sp. E2M01]MBU2869190.1 hypothetical protein [Colwellia sp. E2M01]
MASFGIMAIVSHFSTASSETKQTPTINHTLTSIEFLPLLPDEIEALPTPPLPPKPEVVSPVTTQTVQPAQNTSSSIIQLDVHNSVAVIAISIPTLSEPQKTLDLTYKVLPKYTYDINKALQYGEIQLSYQRDLTGKTTDLEQCSQRIRALG